MSRCEYCGRENEQSAVTCHECGMALVVPLEVPPLINYSIPPFDAAPPIIDRPELNAGRATLILVLTFLGQSLARPW